MASDKVTSDIKLENIIIDNLHIYVLEKIFWSLFRNLLLRKTILENILNLDSTYFNIFLHPTILISSDNMKIKSLRIETTPSN